MTERTPEELQNAFKKMERTRCRSAILLFCLLPAVVAVRVLDVDEVWIYLVYGVILIVGFWGGILQNRCPNCGRFYRPFRKSGLWEVRVCPHCGLDFRTGRIDAVRKH